MGAALEGGELNARSGQIRRGERRIRTFGIHAVNPSVTVKPDVLLMGNLQCCGAMFQY